MKVNILGTDYNIRLLNADEDPHFQNGALCGYCSYTRKEILLLNLACLDDWKNEQPDVIREQQNETLRHEIIHAFLNESGLGANSIVTEQAWSQNEEMVDYFAAQFPKMLKAFKDAECI